jgi:hypothetical protein
LASGMVSRWSDIGTARSSVFKTGSKLCSTKSREKKRAEEVKEQDQPARHDHQPSMWDQGGREQERDSRTHE